MTIKQLVDISGLNQTQFSREYNIPLRRLQAWIGGENEPLDYYLSALEKLVMRDIMTKDTEKELVMYGIYDLQLGMPRCSFFVKSGEAGKKRLIKCIYVSSEAAASDCKFLNRKETRYAIARYRFNQTIPPEEI